MNVYQYVNLYLEEVKTICDTIDTREIQNIIAQLKALKVRKGRLFVLGVGGSAANASHAVNDFRKICGIETYAVTDNVAELTARINDDGWETSYVNWLKVSGFDTADALLIFSVGGGSETTSSNLVRAVEYADVLGATVLGVVSRDGGYTKKHSNACVVVPVVDNSRITPHAEEWQGIVLHLVVNGLIQINE